MSGSNSSNGSEDSRSRRERATDGLRIVVLSGPSGTGKSTIVNRLAAQREVKLIKAISATTRPAREQERDGEDYYFLGKEEFLGRRAVDEFVESFEVHGSGNWYGTLRSELLRAKGAAAVESIFEDVKLPRY